MTDKYTFGDNERASARLRKLADLYESDMRDLLNRLRLPRAPRLAVDLGCGPGYSTEILCQELSPVATVGLDSSQRYIAEARHRCHLKIRFEIHDVTCAPFPVELPDLLFCRFLLTHLHHPDQALVTWAAISAPGAHLIIHETERMETDHPALVRYYQLLSELQNHYGQALQIGKELERHFKDGMWQLIASESRVLRKPAARMAELHLENLATWRHDPFALNNFSAGEIDSLQVSLRNIAYGVDNAGYVLNTAKQIAAVNVRKLSA